MRISPQRTWMSFVISILAIPGLAIGATPAPAPIANFDSFQASNLLNRMQTQAVKVNNDADQLQSYLRSDVSWRSDAIMVDRMADHVRKMDNMLSELRGMQNEVVPLQSRLIARLTPNVTILTDELNDSIHYLIHNQEMLWTPQWRDYASEMFRSSAIVQKDLRHFRQE
jgi:hypothetical protein